MVQLAPSPSVRVMSVPQSHTYIGDLNHLCFQNTIPHLPADQIFDLFSTFGFLLLLPTLLHSTLIFQGKNHLIYDGCQIQQSIHNSMTNRLICSKRSGSKFNPFSVAYVCMLSLQLCLNFCDPWAVAHQASLSMGFWRQDYWSGLPFCPPGDLPDSGIKLGSLVCPALAGRFFTTSTTWGSLLWLINIS